MNSSFCANADFLGTFQSYNITTLSLLLGIFVISKKLVYFIILSFTLEFFYKHYFYKH